MTLPVYVSIEEGLASVETKRCREYLRSVFQTYVRDTPFRQKDITDLHYCILDAGCLVKFTASTVRRELLRMRKDGEVSLFDDSDKKEDRMFVWVGGLPLKTPSLEDDTPCDASFLQEVEGRIVRMEQKEPVVFSNNPLTNFFFKIFKSIFG